MGFVSPDHHEAAHHHHHHHHHHNEEEAIGIRGVTSDDRPTSAHRRISNYDDSDADASDLIHHSHNAHSPVTRHNGKSSSNSSSGNHTHMNNNNNSNSHHNNVHSHNGHGRSGVVGVSGNSSSARFGQSSSPSPIESDSLGRDSPSGNASEIEQVEWLNELQSSGAKIVKVLFPRIANNDKELTVVR